jgi:hypothetical protein
MDVVEIRNGLRAGHVFVIALKLGLGLFLCGAAAYGSWRGAPIGPLAFAWIAGLGGVALGLIHLQVGLDRTIQLVLSPEGFRDRRSGSVLIPWPAVREARNLGPGNTANVIELDLTEDVPVGSDILSGAGNRGSGLRRVRIPLDELDTNAREMLAHIRRFAPHLKS